MAVLALMRSFVLGFCCGLRSMAGPAVLAFVQGRDECGGCAPPPLRLMRSDPGRLGLATAAAGELLVDKTPLVPPRIEPGPLGGRVALGAFSGYLGVRSTRSGRRLGLAVLGATLGGIGAAIGSHAGYHARRFAARVVGLPDPPVALMEDALAYSLGATAARS